MSVNETEWVSENKVRVRVRVRVRVKERVKVKGIKVS